MADIVLAMKSNWLYLILSGQKTAEFRRTMPRHLQCGDKVHLYWGRSLHGVATVTGVHYGASGQLATEFAGKGCIDRNEAQAYLFGGKHPGVIELGKVEKYSIPYAWTDAVVQNFVYFVRKEDWVRTQSARKPTMHGIARGYIRKNREDILKVLWKSKTDLIFIDEDYDAWVRVFKSDRGDSVEILKKFHELVWRLHRNHKRRCSDENCGVLDDLRFYLKSLGEVFKGKEEK